ncbi:reverse transcriptase domain-containing protein [Psychromonas sp. Urea-02u-13]|uniref:reverse transcriptase domain-containing protein n=1 Tax=Psychromonas sp. Urea-02u-13 TaxID=2058326 RepID=UPI000C329347|nr:reverse transcriptase domain-containing protein [Psychromonas sp. Urea-02u-13]PKG38452.1 RNA-directed DNA polymerase [Psychromonas sp. Urea-02u-13]
MNEITHTNFKKNTLQTIFESNFHDKFSFHDFLHFNQEKEYTKVNIGREKIGSKEILKASDKLQSYLRFLNNYIFQYADINKNVVYSYRKGANTYQAVKKHSDNNFFFQTDIKGFFKNVKSADIKFILENNLHNTPISDLKKYEERILSIVTVNDTLPVGFASSPILTNSLLKDFDNELENYCTQNDIVYTRYSDDLILSSKVKDSLIDIEKMISNILNKFFNDSFQLNKEKTKLTHKGNKIKILGMVILPTGKVTVDIKIKKQIESLLHFYINDKDIFIDLVGGNYDDGLAMVSGKINYINTIDPEYLIKLRKKYGNYVVDLFFHQSFK